MYWGQSSNLLPLVLPEQDSDVPGDEAWTGYISAPDISRGKGDEITSLSTIGRLLQHHFIRIQVAIAHANARQTSSSGSAFASAK